MRQHWFKTVLLALLLCLFFFSGGAQAPRPDLMIGARPRARVRLVWECSIALYSLGAATALWGNKRIGDISPVSFRGLYVAAGLAFMVIGFFMMRALLQMQ